MVQEQVDYISKIVSDLQDYARHLKPEFCDIDFPKFIGGVFETIAMPDNIRLNVNAEGFLKIRSDPTFLKRALTNLVNNAIQAMPDGGELGLTVYLKDGKVFIEVSDSGKGIPDDIKPYIFKPLVTTKAKGQGLGLAVVKRLVEAMGGKVSFDSAEGKGTKFKIELPLTPQDRKNEVF
jgi:signal transduction histidine kinase